MEIYLDVLETIRKGNYKPTWIMQKSNVHWAKLKEILDSLVGVQPSAQTTQTTHGTNTQSLTLLMTLAKT